MAIGIGGHVFFGSTPISWYSKRQGTTETSSYSVELCTVQVATEETIFVQYMFRYLEINVKGSMDICGENLGMIIPSTNLGSELKNKHVAISYHKLRESAAASIVNPIKVCTTVHRSDILE